MMKGYYNMNGTTIYIALCDDDKNTHVDVRNLLKSYKYIYKKDVELIEFYSAEELLEANERYDVLLLDYEMPGLNGISAGAELRKSGNNCKIIMLTGMQECYKEAFKISASRFVTKKISSEELYEALNSAILSISGNELIELFYENKKVKRLQRAIDYIKANDDFLKVYIRNDVYLSNFRLEKMEQILDNRIFRRCHKSIIVNFESIERIDDDTITLSDGTHLKIAKRRKSEFMKAFIEYDTRIR